MNKRSLILSHYTFFLLLIHLRAFHIESFLLTNRSPLLSVKHVKTNTALSLEPKAKYDFAVLGAGPVGVKAALLAALKFEKKVILIDAPLASGALMSDDKDLSIGGPTGLFSKALRDTSKRIRVDSLRGMGLRDDSIWNEIVQGCVDLAAWNANDVQRQLKDASVDYVQGFASFISTDEVLVTSTESTSEVKATKILIATGSKPFQPQGIPFDGKRIFDSDSINSLSFLPTSVAISGSGIVAIEFAKIFKNLGSEVTLIIRDIVPKNALIKVGFDKDVAAMIIADLVRSGIKFERDAEVKSFVVPSEELDVRAPIQIHLEKKGGGERPKEFSSQLNCDAYLAAVGRRSNIDDLNLTAAGIKVDSYGGLVVDSKLCTTASGGNIYGAGDVIGRPFLASTGVAQAAAVVLGVFGEDSSLDGNDNEGSNNKGNIDTDINVIPGETITPSDAVIAKSFDPKSLSDNPFALPTSIWSSPEVAVYGLTLQQASELSIQCDESIALYSQCMRGLIFNPNGLLKLVYDTTNGRILGVHICGDDACELIHYGMELVKGHRKIEDLVNNIYSALTYHEMYGIAARAATDKAGARKQRAAAGSALAARNRAARN